MRNPVAMIAVTTTAMMHSTRATRGNRGHRVAVASTWRVKGESVASVVGSGAGGVVDFGVVSDAI
jgi:hypothetical protein